MHDDNLGAPSPERSNVSQPSRTDDHLLVFARVPKPGTNKTRLIPALGAEKAAELYRQFVGGTLRQARQWMSGGGGRVTVCYTGGSMSEAQTELGPDLHHTPQIESGLGERLQFATRAAFAAGAARVVVIGTDCPALTAADLQRAFQQLEHHDVVLGPALDGGYYMIGLRADHPNLFDGIDWSTAVVFEPTRQRAQAMNLQIHVLRPLSDVDHPEDLLPLRNQAKEGVSLPFAIQRGRLSVIIPTLNEAANLPTTLQSVGTPDDRLEILVVDAGSSDSTLEVARQYGCRAFVGNRGRANQMNAGAAVATGEFLLFLHADTRLPGNYRPVIEQMLSTQFVGGAFSLAIDSPGFLPRIIEAAVAFRSRFLKRPYGDQALFFRAADFYANGGYKPLALMEDYEFVGRIRKGGRIGIASQLVTTSARRWLKHGFARTTLLNQLCVLGYHLGVSDQRLAKFYYGARKKK